MPEALDTRDHLDEAFDGSGAPRGAYAELLARVGSDELIAERERVRRRLVDAGVTFGGEGRTFDVDPMPRIIEAAEWERVERGLAQRARALNAFLDDVYGERRVVAAGLVGAELLEGAEWFEPAMREEGMPRVRAHVVGPDLVRGAEGELRVLEDNARAPSGLAYAVAAREAMAPVVEASGLRPRSPEAGVEALGAMLRGAAPNGSADPSIVLLNDGPGAAAAYEHRVLARAVGMRVARMDDLHREGERLLLGDEPVDVVYRRVDDERLSARDGSPNELGELLIEPLRAGTLACVNSPGSGVADDKAIHTVVEDLIGFYLDEPVLLHSVPGRWLGEPGALSDTLGRLGELVVKPRWEFGGTGIVIGPVAGPEELAAAAGRVRADPAAWVAQEPVSLSVHPTVVDGALASRHVDLRPFVITDQDEVTVVPGGLTRFARGEGEMVVNSGQGGGAKDTWILPG